MPSLDNKVRVFISSTFRDMHAERDHLVTVVFPELRERCERLGLEFFDVDLRWGVPEKTVDGETANSWEYCRQWIDRVEPFFVCMLGQRYGWEPEPHQLKDADDRARQVERKRSITDMEVRHAVLNTKLKRHSYFYLRDAEAPATASDFVDPPPLLAKLDQLKTEVRACDRPVRDYPCEWKDNAFTGMEEFGKAVLDDLWSGVLRDERYVSKEVWRQVLGTDPDADPLYTDESLPVPDDIAEKLIPLAKPAPKDPLEAERDEMQRFADSRLRWFQGRTKELYQLTAFIRNPAEDNKPRLAVIAAFPGQGKSALMAKLWESLQPKETKEDKQDSATPSLPVSSSPSLFIFAHFVGATEQSSTAYALVKRLNDELDASGIAFPERPTPEGQPKEELKLDFNSLCQRLWDLLGDYAGERRIVILLDALNQLNDGHDLGWLPYRLGPGVRIVVSCIEETPADSENPQRGTQSEETQSAGSLNLREKPHSECDPSQKVLATLNSRHPKPLRIPLGALTAEDVSVIVLEYFAEYCKELDAPHVEAICDEEKLPQARNPLYLLVMLAELRTLGGNEMNKIVPELIANMATEHPTTVSLFKWVLQRMEAAEGFGAAATGWWCLYLALGRVGIASRELTDLLARKFNSQEAALTAQRIERGLRRYLQRRGETLDFFHGQLRQAVFESYGHEDSIREAHQDIADYFRALADPDKNQSWSGNAVRSFNEFAFHLIGGQQWDDLCAYLTDFRCLDVRIRASQVFAVFTDHRAAIAALPELAEEARREEERVKICAQYGAALITYAGDCADGKDPRLPRPPATMEATDNAANPEEHSLRAHRLRAIANFTGQQATMLAAHPKDFLTWAANAAEGSPLAEAAEAADAAVGPWLHRDPRPPTPPLHSQCLQILRGHTSSVISVSVTADGRRAVSASHHTLRVWDLQSGQCLLTLQGHTNKDPSVSITPDGRRAVSASWDKTLRFWDLQSGQCLLTLRGHTNEVTSVDITPDGRRAVSASWDKTLRVWDLQSGQCFLTLQGHTSKVTSVSITPDGRRAVSAGGDDETLRVWDLQSGQCLLTLKVHTQYVTSVSITPDGRRAVSANTDYTLRVWDLQTGQSLVTLQGHTNEVLSVSITPDGRRAVSASSDKTLRVWDLQSGQCLLTLQGHTDSVRSVSITPDGRRAVSAGSYDRTLRVWDLESRQSPITLQGHTRDVTSVSITPDGRRTVSASSDKTLRVWDLQSGQPLHTLKGHSAWVQGVSITPDNRRAVSAGGEEALRVWDLQSGQSLHTLQGHTRVVTSVRITPDGRLAVSASYDKTLRVWDLQSGQPLHTLQGHTRGVTSVRITPDGRLAVSASDDRTLRVWDLQSGQCLHTFQGHTPPHPSNLVPDPVTVSITPDSRLAVSAGGHDKTLRVWDLDSGQCLHTLQGHSAWVWGASVTPDGRCFVSASADRTLRVWDLQSGQCLLILKGHTNEVTSVDITPDGRRAVSASEDRTLRVWDLQSGQRLQTLLGHTQSVSNVRVTPDGRLAVSAGGHDKTVRVWDLQDGQCLAIYLAGDFAVHSVAVSPNGDRIVFGADDGQMHFLTMRNFPS